ncbi:MAG: substrate-binding domain-containing protein [Beutenbergiaceae bacterium]
MKKSLRPAVLSSAAAALVVGLAACGTTGDTSTGGSDSDSGGDSSSDTYMIATVPKVEGISWFQAMEVGVDQFNEDQGEAVDAWQIGPDTEDAAKQVQIIEDLIAQNVDAIVVVPNDPQAVAPALTKAREAGIVVISHEAPALAGTDAVDYDLEAFDNAVFGEAMFEQLAEGMGGEGTFAGMVGSLTSETHMAWYNAGIAYLEENYPNITPVTDQPYEDNNDDATARANALEILNAYPDLDGYVNCSVSAGSNMAAVLQEKNNSDVKISGLSLPSVAAPFLDEGWMYSAQTWNPAGAGYAGNALALMILQGEAIETGADLGFDGYESVTVADGMVVGDAIMMLTADQFPDGDYPF